jgi:hypothetical protein
MPPFRQTPGSLDDGRQLLVMVERIRALISAVPREQ